MRRLLCLLVLAAATLPASAQAQSRAPYRRVQASPQQQPRRPAARRAAARNAMNAFIQRLMSVEPERRREMLANNERYQRLPVAQRRAIESRLQEFDKLPSDRKELLLQRYELFSRLRQNQQAEARTLFRDWSQLPRERRNRITLAVRRLRNATPQNRRQALQSERFENLYQAEDRRLIERLLSLEPQVEDEEETPEQER